MSVIRVLVADDHPVVRAGLSGMLASQADLEVIGEAKDGEEAVALSISLQPDVVLMDLHMPGLDGVGAIRQIRAQRDRPSILVLTTYDTDAGVLAAVEAGANGYLLKDAPREELFGAIRAAAAGGAPLAPAVAARLMQRLRTGGEEPLSARETDVLQLVARGSSNAEIARDLRISEATVKTHLVHIFEKLGVGDRTSAVTTALQRGLIDLPGNRSMG
jgi:DNA-binding NarL/FixJ family response regulator